METADFPTKDVAQCIPDATQQPKDKDTEGSSRSVLKLWKKFGDNTSMHGIGRAINSSRIWKKIIWSLLVIGAAVIASRNLYMTFVDYFSYPVSTKVSLETKLFLDFPAVTFCNLNPYRFRNLKEEIKAAVEKSVKNGDDVKRQKEIFTMEFNKHYGLFNIPDNISHSYSNMLVDCYFDMEMCDAYPVIQVPNSKNGDCYTFNFDAKKRRNSTRAGSNNGLILELDVEQDDYLPFTPSAGLKVLIHPPEAVPFPHEDGMVVRPGVSTSIGLRKVAIKREIPPWGNCIKEEDTNDDNMNMFRTRYFNGHRYGYSQMACEKTCYQLELQRNCSCCDETYPCPEVDNRYFQSCNQSNQEVLDCLNFVRDRYLSGRLSCMSRCWPPCEESMFLTSYSVAAWPSVKYADNFNRKAAQMRSKKNESGDVKPEKLRRNFVRLEVHYEKLTEKTIEASPAYTWNKLLSDLGGQLGLWMGFSLMTAVEFLELGWDFIGKLCCKLRNVSRRSDVTKC